MKKLRLLLWIAIIGCLGLTAWMVYYAKTPLNIRPDAQEITIKPNSSLKSIAKQLVAQGVLKTEWPFVLLAKVLNKAPYLQAGDYTLNKMLIRTSYYCRSIMANLPKVRLLLSKERHLSKCANDCPRMMRLNIPFKICLKLK